MTSQPNHDAELSAKVNWHNACWAMKQISDRRASCIPLKEFQFLSRLLDIAIEEEMDAWDRYTEIKNLKEC
jgi:hypothetical protein